MTPERWRQIEDVLDRVLDAPESEREGILAEACAGDVELRREVTRLLAATEQSESMFEAPPLLVAREVLEAGDADRDHVNPGDLIGPWRIVRLLGRGGMGAVYLAERADGAFEKNVALKIVKRGMDTDEIIQRFHHERRILARLQHPNIAGLHDGGVTPDGLPYFVMDLASGQPIDAWCDEHTLTIRERLRLFQTVCLAVQYAHGSLVVHRDLKPGNILVADGDVKLLDFGIAKLLGPDASALPHVTQAYAARLTPQYASPEQIRGLPTTTSGDVYSLGVILYELICGRSPYRLEGKTLLEMEQTICNEEPPRPSLAVRLSRNGTTAEQLARTRGLMSAESLVHALAGDVDAICMKALTKNAEDRYISAVALAEDIERYLDGRPVRAHPPQRGYRLRKFIQRNTTAVVLAATTAIVMIASSVTLYIQGNEARRAGLRAQAEGERATANLGFLLNTIGSFDPEGTGQRVLTSTELIQRGMENLVSLESQPVLSASVRNALGQLAYNFGLDSQADSLFRQALARLGATADSVEQAASLLGLGQIKRKHLQSDSAEYFTRRAVDLYRRAKNVDRARVAQSMRELGLTLYARGDTAALREAESLYRAVLAMDSLNAAIVADTWEGLADVEDATDRPDSATAHYDLAMRVRSREFGEEHPGNARGMWGPVLSLVGHGQPGEAQRLARRALEILQSKYGHYHHDVAWAYLFLGYALAADRKYEDAAEAFRQSALIADSVETPGYLYRGQAWYLYARNRFRIADLAGAEAAVRKSLDIYALPDSTTREPENLANSRRLLAQIREKRGAPQEAVAMLRLAFDGYVAVSATDPSVGPEAESTATELAGLYQRLGQPDSAAVWRRRALSVRGR
jgi:serine/threonine-protein kinase